MDLNLKSQLPVGLALAGSVGAAALTRGLGRQYQKQALKETGTAFVADDRNEILKKYTEKTGKPAPQVGVNTEESGTSYSTTGQISLNFPQASKFTLGHELGHQSIETGGGPLSWLQTNTYAGLNPNVVGLATVGAAAAAPSFRRAASLALGINYLNHSGRIVSEIEATRRGAELVKSAGYPISPGTALMQTGSYVTAPAITALGGLAAGRFLRSYLAKI